MDFVWIILFVLLGIFLIISIIIFIIANMIRKSILGKRYDDNGTLHYFSVDDYDDLNVKNVKFYSEKNELSGYFYYKTNIEYKALLILSHGLGAGHVQYMTEINYFTNQGFLVFSYDIRGTLNSSGKGIGYLFNAVKDLKAALDYIDKIEELKKYKKVLFGHSMGGYAVNNILALKKDISCVVSLSSFISSYSLISDLLKDTIGRNGLIFSKVLKMQDYLRGGKYAKLNSIDSIKSSNVPVLLVAGEKDNIVKVENSFNLYEAELNNKQNVEFLRVEKRYHRPNITIRASEYDQKVNAEISLFNQKKIKDQKQIKDFYNKFDYNLLVELDDEIMNKIIIFIEKNIK